MKLMSVALSTCLVVPAAAQVLGLSATEVTQLANHAELVAQYARMAEQLKEEVQQSAYMLKNLNRLPQTSFGNITSEINQLAAIAQYGQGLAYSMANVDSLFRMRYPGYVYVPGANYYQQYQLWSRTALDTMSGSLRLAGLSSTHQMGVMGIIATLRSALSGSDGHMKALMAMGQIADQQNESLQQMRALMLADLQSKQAYQGMQIQKEATAAATSEQFFQYLDMPSSGKTYGAGWK